MIIGIDIDNTITNTYAKTMEYLAFYDQDCDDWHNLKPDQKKEFLELYIEKIMGECTLKDYVIEAFNELKKLGYKIILITARNNNYSPKVKDLTIAYFKKYNLPIDEIIFDDKLIAKKGPTAHKNKVSLFIDDKEENLDDVNSYHIECLKFASKKEPKNQSKYKTFTNWYDIIEYIKKERTD